MAAPGGCRSGAGREHGEGALLRSASVQASATPSAASRVPRPERPLGSAVRLLLWDYARGSVPYDLVLLLVVLIVLLVPGGFWGDPLWAR